MTDCSTIYKQYTSEAQEFNIGHPVRLRAIVIKHYPYFVHCAVQALRDEVWEYVYDKCFNV